MFKYSKKDGKSVAGYSFNGFFHLVSFYTNDNSNITQRYYYDYRGRRISESPFLLNIIESILTAAALL